MTCFTDELYLGWNFEELVEVHIVEAIKQEKEWKKSQELEIKPEDCEWDSETSWEDEYEDKQVFWVAYKQNFTSNDYV